ncbi:Dynamin-related protein 4C [Raphanus sativus]|nr:Dynamin-related protein 4C [Raphanus sativus]
MTLMDIIGSAKESLLRILIQGDFSEFPENHSMHGTARLADMLSKVVDNLALYLQLSVKYLVNTQFQKEVVAEMVDPKGGGGVERMLEESSTVANKREKLRKSLRF